MRPMRSWASSGGAGGTAICTQVIIGPTPGLRAVPLFLHQRAHAFAQRAESLVARNHGELLEIVVGVFRLVRGLDLEEIHVPYDPAVLAHPALLGHEVVHRHD